MAVAMSPCGRKQIPALELNIAGLMKLLGGTPAERERYWEILKGLTTPRELQMAESALDHVNASITAASATLSALHSAAMAEHH